MSLVRGFFTDVAKATVWRASSKDKFGAVAYSSLGVIDCTYSSNTKLQSDSRGREFMPALAIYTKAAYIQEGDLIAIGVVSSATPPKEAKEVRRISTAAPMYGTRDFDIFVS